MYVNSVESAMVDTLGQPLLFFERRLSSLGRSKCIGNTGGKYIGTSSCVLCREDFYISECPYRGFTCIHVHIRSISFGGPPLEQAKGSLSKEVVSDEGRICSQ